MLFSHVIGGIVLLVGGSVICALAGKQALQVSKLVGVRAVIKASQIVPCVSHTGRAGTTVVVKYDYEYEGKKYTSEQSPFWRPFTSKRTEDNALKNYPPGKVMTIYIDPQRPVSSVIRRYFAENVTYSTLGLFFLFVAVLLLLG